jgi:4-hydroxy-2-oxoheptanedioate aldolase
LKGEKLSRVLSEEERLTFDEKEYLSNYNLGNVCIINIESMPALNALDEILNVPDVDAVLVGPHDLSINMGIPEQYDHPLFEATVQKVIQKGRCAGVGVGMHYSGVDATEKFTKWARSGMNLIIYSSDLKIVGNTLERNVANLRVALDGVDDTPAGIGGADIHV